MIVFEWDENKARANLRKHGIHFEDALLVFDDPYALSGPERAEGGEIRWQTIGLASGIVLILVAHTVREAGQDEVIRIISARRATREEVRRYVENREEDV